MAAIGRGLQFRDDTNKPVFDRFLKPQICDSELGEEECCSLCGSWMACIKRFPFRLDLSGFDFSEWLPWVRQSPALFQTDNVASFTGSSSGTNEWNGVFVVLPLHEGYLSDGVRHRTHIPCGSHWDPTGRTVSTPNSAIAPISRFYLDLFTECTVNDENEKCIRFWVMLLYEFETAEHDDFLPWDYAGGEPPGFMIPSDAEYKPHGCCPLLASDCLPVETLTWADLEGVQLRPVEPEALEDGVSQGASASCDYCDADYMYHTISKLNPPPEEGGPEDLFDCSITSDVEGVIVSGPPVGINNCPPHSRGILYGQIGPGPIFAGCYNTWCCPPPIIINNPDPAANTLSILAKDCNPRANCGYCAPEPPSNPVRVIIQPDFHWNLGETCCKTFQAEYPECLADATFIWSFGKEGKVVRYCLRNTTDDSPVNYSEVVLLTIIDPQGCIYYVEKIVTCGCACDGMSASVNIGVNSQTCLLTIEVSLNTGNCDPSSPFVELCGLPVKLVGPVEDCLFDSDELDLNDRTCFTFRDGGSFSMTLPIQCFDVHWRIWDLVCTCPGPWTHVQVCCNKCECCNGPIGGAIMTIDSVGTAAAVCDCSAINNIEMDVPAAAGNPCQRGAAEFETVSLGVACGNAYVNLGWLLYCPEDGSAVEGYWLRLGYTVNLEGGSPGGQGQDDVYLGLEKPTCADMARCVQIHGGGHFGSVCNFDNVEVCAEFY